MLERHGLEFERERVLGPRDRIDFLVNGGLGIEVKVKGSADAAEAQLRRYAEHDAIAALMLVTARRQVALTVRELNGKPLSIVYLVRSSFG